MDVVTITDHDAIGGWQALMDARPDADDILPGEEVSCRLPDGNVEVHLGVYGITERLHAEIQPLRRNVFDVIALLRESGTLLRVEPRAAFLSRTAAARTLPAAALRGAGDGDEKRRHVRAHNSLAERLSREWRGDAAPIARVAGSDAHTLRRVGRTWTEAPGTTAKAFLASLSAGLGKPGGDHGGA